MNTMRRNAWAPVREAKRTSMPSYVVVKKQRPPLGSWTEDAPHPVT
jgi:hypothetical protein